MLRNRSIAQMTAAATIVWAVILIVGAIIDRHQFSGSVFDVLLLVFGGFVIGWVLAMMARGRSVPPRN